MITMNKIKEEFCRLCADLKLCSELINISIDVDKLENINKMLKRFDIALNLDKHLPKSVCLACLNSLEQAYEFVSYVDLAQKAYEEYVPSDVEFDEADVYLDIDHSAEVTTETNTLTDSEISEEMTGEDGIFNFKKDEEFNEGRETKRALKTEEISKKIEVYGKDMAAKNNKEFIIDENSTKKYKVCKIFEEVEKDMQLKEFDRPLLRNIVDNKKIDAQPIEDTSETDVIELKKGRKKSLKMLISSESTVSWSTYKWVCAYCDNYYSSPSELRVHSMQYHNVCNPFRCFDCRAQGSQIEKFVAHVCKHRPNLSLLCYICYTEFETTGELKEHKIRVHISTNFSHICGATFQTKEELQNHINNFYKNVTIRMLPYKDNEILICVICKKILKTKVLLNRHLLLHTDRQRSYLCEICKKRFYTKRELNQHVVVHSDKRPFKCEICDYSFKIKYELKKHVQKHFEMKRFTCDQCGKSFHQRKELIIHNTIHKDSRSFICAYCNKAFRFKHLLLQHIRVHTGEKPYCCDRCPQRFRNWPNYNRHSKHVHGINRARKKTTSDNADPNRVMKWKNYILASKKKGRSKKLDD